MSKQEITVYGAYWCPDCRVSKQFLGEHQIPYNWVNIEEDKEAEQFITELNDGKRDDAGGGAIHQPRAPQRLSQRRCTRLSEKRAQSVGETVPCEVRVSCNIKSQSGQCIADQLCVAHRIG